MYRTSFLQYYLFILVAITNTILPQQLAVKSYSVEDGLVQSSVYTIIQDRFGYIWFGTEGGLSKFDGLQFTNYTTAQGLPDNFITCMIEDRIGRIWLGTMNGGIVIYDGKKFINLTIKDGLSSNSILTIQEDHNGVFWIGTDEGGLNKYENEKFTHFGIRDGLQSNSIRSISQDHSGNLWFSSSTSGGGICKYDGKKFTIYSRKDGLDCDSVLSIFEASDGFFWLGTYKGISKFDGNKFYSFDPKLKIPGKITSIYQDTKKIIWFTTYGNGLIKYENGHFSYFNIRNGLTADILQTVMQDRRGDLWIGTSDGGVDQIPIERFISYTRKDGLPKDAVYAINEDKQGNIWFGTYGGGICKLDGDRFKVLSTIDGLPDNYISTIKVDKNGALWIGSIGGLSKFQKNKFTNYTRNDGLINNFIFSIDLDKENNLWIGTNGGLSKFDGKKFTNYVKSDGIPDNTIYSVRCDNKGLIWLATINGLSKYNGKEFENYSTKNGLINNTVFCIYQDKNNELWFGTQGGLSIIKNDKFKNYTVNDGLSNNQCFFITEDNEDFYIGTSKGVDRIKTEQLYKDKNLNFKIYTIKEGLANSECSVGAVFHDSKGNLWFGTSKGVTRFNPENAPNLFSPPVYITNFKIFDKDTVVEKDLKLSYTQNYLKIGFLAIDYVSPERVKYKYILEGIDNNWSTTSERIVSYPYLPPGKYKFRVLAQSSDGVWSRDEASYTFTIQPPFWETVWFRTILGLTAFSLIIGTYKYKTNQVKRRNIELARMVSERTKELEYEKNKSDDLLKNILPVTLVDELKAKGYVKPREFKSISIMFTDFKGFSYIANVLPPERLVSELNDIFKNFDEIIQKYELEKLKTVGDSYMVGAGLPEEIDDHAVRIIDAALEMQTYIQNRNKISPIKWEMRAGIHTGSVIAGVVGTRKFTYDIWGENVNIASRMESAGLPGEINISAYTYMLVKEKFKCVYRGKISTKGTGELDMYLVKGKDEN